MAQTMELGRGIRRVFGCLGWGLGALFGNGTRFLLLHGDFRRRGIFRLSCVYQLVPGWMGDRPDHLVFAA
jgi:hypothetical protein